MNRLDDPRWDKTQFLVQASSTEFYCLWKEFSHESPYDRAVPNVHWQFDSMGRALTIGELDGMPICLGFRWAKLNGILVCFYEVSSQVIDWRRVDEWVAQHFKGSVRDQHCDAMNFHNCLLYVRQQGLSDTGPGDFWMEELAMAHAVLNGDRVAARALHDHLTERYGEQGASL